MSSGYADHYAQFHPDTPAHDAELRRLYGRWLGPHLPDDRAARILDVGCGRGYAVAWLRDLGYSAVSGIDPDPAQAAFGQARGWPVLVAPDVVGNLRGCDGSLDAALLMDVLEHVPRAQQQGFLEVIRVALRPGGRLICTVPNASSVLGSHWRHHDYTHTTSFTVESVEHVLALAGFRVCTVGPAEFFVRPRYLFWLPTRRALQWWLLRLVRLAARTTYLAELGFTRGSRVPLSLNLVAVAKRPE